MSIIKRADARNVLPFPVRTVEPLLIDRAMAANRRQLEANRLRRLDALKWAAGTAAAVALVIVVGFAMHWWWS